MTVIYMSFKSCRIEERVESSHKPEIIPGIVKRQILAQYEQKSCQMLSF